MSEEKRKLNRRGCGACVGREGWLEAWRAMLTGEVNIAVFAVFRCCCCGGLGANAEFKPVRVDRQLDIWCYGWQKWQETASGCCRFRQRDCHLGVTTRTNTEETEGKKARGGREAGGP